MDASYKFIIIGSNIQYLLKRSGMSRHDLAVRLGVSDASVGFWCIGKKCPRMDKVDRMCAVFGCERSDILVEPSIVEKKAREIKDYISDISPDEMVLIEGFRCASQDARDNMLYQARRAILNKRGAWETSALSGAAD